MSLKKLEEYDKNSKESILNKINYILKYWEDIKVETHFRFCPNCNHTNTKKESLNKYTCGYCSGEEDNNY